MKLTIRIFFIFLLTFSGIFFSCGYYSFSGALPSNLKTIALPIFEDRTTEFGLREKLNEKLTDKFIKNGNLKITDFQSANLILNGTILQIDDKPAVFEKTETVTDYQIAITVKVSCLDVGKNKPFWEESLRRFYNYKINEGAAAREAAIEKTLEDLAEDILNKTIAGW